MREDANIKVGADTRAGEQALASIKRAMQSVRASAQEVQANIHGMRAGTAPEMLRDTTDAIGQFDNRAFSAGRAVNMLNPLLGAMGVRTQFLNASMRAATLTAGGLNAALTNLTVGVRGFLVSIGPLGWALLAVGAAATTVSYAWARAARAVKENEENNKRLNDILKQQRDITFGLKTALQEKDDELGAARDKRYAAYDDEIERIKKLAKERAEAHAKNRPEDDPRPNLERRRRHHEQENARALKREEEQLRLAKVRLDKDLEKLDADHLKKERDRKRNQSLELRAYVERANIAELEGQERALAELREAKRQALEKISDDDALGHLKREAVLREFQAREKQLIETHTRNLKDAHAARLQSLADATEAARSSWLNDDEVKQQLDALRREEANINRDIDKRLADKELSQAEAEEERQRAAEMFLYRRRDAESRQTRLSIKTYEQETQAIKDRIQLLQAQSLQDPWLEREARISVMMRELHYTREQAQAVLELRKQEERLTRELQEQASISRGPVGRQLYEAITAAKEIADFMMNQRMGALRSAAFRVVASVITPTGASPAALGQAMERMRVVLDAILEVLRTQGIKLRA